MKSIRYIGGLLVLILLGLLPNVYAIRTLQVTKDEDSGDETAFSRVLKKAPIHKDILTTIFWVGERAKPRSGWSSNLDSAWDMRWKENFGGLDSPVYRTGFFPSKFRPKQNPFYIALPFNDISNPEHLDSCPILQYFKAKKTSRSSSICKNRWIEIIYDGKSCYGQWQDVGPIYTDDYEYVFLGQKPKAHDKEMAGLDISPAIRDYLSIKSKSRSTWRFVDESEVSEGPWKTIVTRS